MNTRVGTRRRMGCFIEVSKRLVNALRVTKHKSAIPDKRPGSCCLQKFLINLSSSRSTEENCCTHFVQMLEYQPLHAPRRASLDSFASSKASSLGYVRDALSRSACWSAGCTELRRRNPQPSWALSGRSANRAADRAFQALSIQLPPRSTRYEP